jgi:hypothetical protein
MGPRLRGDDAGIVEAFCDDEKHRVPSPTPPLREIVAVCTFSNQGSFEKQAAVL